MFPALSVKAAGTHIFVPLGLSFVHAKSPAGNSIIIMGDLVQEDKELTRVISNAVVRNG